MSQRNVSVRPRPPKVTVHAVGPARWRDLEKLFGPRGACGGCWCMSPRLAKSDFERGLGAPNKRALKKLALSGAEPGLLAYAGDEPVGWLALAPRPAYARLARSRVLAPVDGVPVWSAVCFFIARPWRRRGVTVALLKAAVKYVRARDGRVLEGYPIEPRAGRWPDAFIYHGAASAFRHAGFVEVARRSPTRPIMRYYLKRAARAVNVSEGNHHAG